MSPDPSPAADAPLRRVALGLGANLGDRLAALQTAVQTICQDPAVAAVAVSEVFETDPVGGPEQPDYLNAVLVVDTSLVPIEVLALAQLAEADLGRRRDVRWGARTLDVDVLAYGDVVSDDPTLTLPHPRATQRAFVLVPWAQADPEFAVPGTGETVAQLSARPGSSDVAGVRRWPFGGLQLPD